VHLCPQLARPSPLRHIEGAHERGRLTRERVTQPYSLPHHAPAAAHVQGRRARQTTWRLSPPAVPGPGAERERCRASGRLNCRGPAVGGPNGPPHLGVIADAVLACGDADVEFGGQLVMAALGVERGRRARGRRGDRSGLRGAARVPDSTHRPAAATIETTSAAMTMTATVVALRGPARAARGCPPPGAGMPLSSSRLAAGYAAGEWSHRVAHQTEPEELPVTRCLGELPGSPTLSADGIPIARP
jgi:hypothetical protein